MRSSSGFGRFVFHFSSASLFSSNQFLLANRLSNLGTRKNGPVSSSSPPEPLAPRSTVSATYKARMDRANSPSRRSQGISTRCPRAILVSIGLICRPIRVWRCEFGRWTLEGCQDATDFLHHEKASRLSSPMPWRKLLASVTSNRSPARLSAGGPSHFFHYASFRTRLFLMHTLSY